MMEKNNIRRLLDSILIIEIIIIIGLPIFLWFLLPPLIGLLFELYEKTQSNIINFLINITIYFVVNLPRVLIIALGLIAILLIIFVIFNIVNAIKKKRFGWFFTILFINIMSVIYYFKYYRKELKNPKKGKDLNI